MIGVASMYLLLAKVMLGLLVGVLVGLTGVGGGVLLLPLLIFGLGIPPLIAVGSDAVFNSATKFGAGYLHWRQGTVRRHILLALLSGSIPGCLGGVLLLVYLRNTYGAGVNSVLEAAVGLLLLIIPSLLLIQGQLKPGAGPNGGPERCFWGRLAAIGLLAGILVGLTSIGSGSVTLMLLMLIYPDAPLIVVGTDIAHAVALTTVTSALHFNLGTVNLPLVAALLLGSVPGALIGTKLSPCIPGHWLKRILCGLLFLTGARMLFL